jgi:tRNA pseudouridine55 synthase
MDGVLIVDKPGGMTSAAVVAKVKRACGARKVGHTGTLDPMATGVLPLCLGEATKIAGFLLAEDKEYEGELLLGVETDTLDADGKVTAEAPERALAVSQEALEEAMARLVGRIEQVPPMFSAVRVGGRRLHQLARRGETVEREAREVVVRRFDLEGFSPPRARFAVECEKGTYVRALVRDLGRALGCGAHLASLRRTRAGAFDLARAAPLADVVTDPASVPGHLISPAEALAHLPAVEVPPARLPAVGCGTPLAWADLGAAEASATAPSGLFRLLTPAGDLLAVAREREGRLSYERVFPYVLTARRGSSNLPPT